METKSISDPNLFDSYPKESPIENGFLYDFGERTYRALEMNLQGLSRLKVNLKVTLNDRFHIDTLDLYLDRARERYAQVSAERLNADQSAILQELYTLIETLDKKRVELLKAKPDEVKSKEMTKEGREEAMKFLRSPDLIEEIQKDFDACGYIGEETPRLFCYLATISRFLKYPLGVLMVSRSAAGKSSLQQAVLKFVPEEDLQDFDRLSGKSLYYKISLKHKVLAITEDEGALEAIYPIRILASEQRLRVSVANTDPKTGQKRTEDFSVEGPTSVLWGSTCAEKIDFETRNRFCIVTIDESREQTKRILQKQREQESLEGVLESEEEEVVTKKHHNAQRLLKKLKVINPYFDELTYPDDNLLMRREQKKYLTLIKTITFLHQYQREIKREKTRSGKEIDYIEATIEDIALANKLAAEVLGRSLDELSPHTRKLLKLIKQMTQERSEKEKKKREFIFFTRRSICEYTGWSYFQTREPLETLVQMEYLILSKEKNNQYFYELIWDGEGEGGEKFFMGLIDVERLRKNHSGLRGKKGGLRAD